MTGSRMQDAFAHHVWATLRLIDTCIDVWDFGYDTGRVVDFPPTS